MLELNCIESLNYRIIQRIYLLRFQLTFKANIQIIRESYMELACKGQYQDALILNLMYSLSLDPYHIY